MTKKWVFATDQPNPWRWCFSLSGSTTYLAAVSSAASAGFFVDGSSAEARGIEFETAWPDSL